MPNNLNKMLKELNRVSLETYFDIAGISSKVKPILLDMYIEDMTRVELSIKYNYSIETITKKKNKALCKLNNAINQGIIIVPNNYKELLKK